MNFMSYLPFILFLLLLNNTLLLGAPNARYIVRFTAFQGCLLAGLLVCLKHFLLAFAVLAIKAVFLPIIIERTRKRLQLGNTIVTRLHKGVAVFCGLLGLVFAFWLEARMLLLPELFPSLLFPTALTTLFCGFILVMGRATAISQVMGYLVAENGIFLLGIPLMAAGEAWFEFALLLDVFVAVFVMGIAINHIGETFESMEVGSFRNLRD